MLSKVSSKRSLLNFSPLARLGIGITSIISLIAFTWPLYLPKSVFGAELTQQHYWIFFLIVPASLLFLAAEINRGVVELSALALLAVLAALAAALRQIGAGAVGIEPMWFLLILAARVFGATFGFALGAISMTFSAILTGGIGPWLPFQIMAAAWIGLFAGSLPKSIRGRYEILMLIVVAIVAGMTFGFLMDLQLWPWILGGETGISFIPGAGIEENFERFITFHFLTAMAWDIPRSIITASLIAITASPILNALRRTKRRVLFVDSINEHEMGRKAV